MNNVGLGRLGSNFPLAPPGLAGGADFRQVLEFNPPVGGGPGPWVDHGRFLPANTVLGSCVYEAWVKPILLQPSAPAGYFLIMGVGGAHGMALGVAGDPLRYRALWYTGVTSTTALQQACDLPQYGEWTHVFLAFSSDGIYFLYLNGILTGCELVSGTRKSGTLGSDCNLLVGGHTHDEFKGRFAWAAAWDTDVYAAAPNFGEGFRPSRVPELFRNQPAAGTYADFVGDYTKPGTIVPDLSMNQIPPLTLTKYRFGPLHHGVPGYSQPDSQLTHDPSQPWIVPRWVRDIDCPVFATGDRIVPGAYSKPPETPPADKTFLVWDSFSRRSRRSTYVDILGGIPTLGDSEALGTLGALTYLYRPPVLNAGNFNYGVYSGNAFFAGDNTLTYDNPAYVDVGTAEGGVQMRRPDGALAGSSILNLGPGLVTRLSDLANMWTVEWRTGDLITVAKFVAGVRTARTAVALVASADSVRLEHAGNDFILSSGQTSAGVTAWTVIDTFTDAFNATATKRGISSPCSWARWANWGAF